jgi:NTP pyrophosphatase (non-canonical NTP hydrolase)
MRLAEWQHLMEQTYGDRDRARGMAASVAWLAEEVGELAKAARKGSRAEQEEELADVLAWVTSIANQLEISLEVAASNRYATGCPKCNMIPCNC